MARIELHDTDDGRPVAVRRGDTVEAALEETPTTGYRWQFRPDPGAGGLRRFAVEVEAAGLLQVHAVLRREWEPGPRRTLRFLLDATEN